METRPDAGLGVTFGQNGGRVQVTSPLYLSDLGQPHRVSWRREWPPTPVFLPWKSHGQRSLVGYGPWGPKESDTTKQLGTHPQGE